MPLRLPFLIMVQHRHQELRPCRGLAASRHLVSLLHTTLFPLDKSQDRDARVDMYSTWPPLEGRYRENVEYIRRSLREIHSSDVRPDHSLRRISLTRTSHLLSALPLHRPSSEESYKYRGCGPDSEDLYLPVTEF